MEKCLLKICNHSFSVTSAFSAFMQIGFTFLVPAHPGSPGKRAVKCVCVLLYDLWV